MVLLVIVFSCNQGFDQVKEPEKGAEYKWNEYPVSLMRYISVEDMNLTNEMISPESLKGITRSNQSNDAPSFISYSSASDIILKIYEDNRVINFDAASEEDLEKNIQIIMDDIDGITRQEVIDNYAEIAEIYNTQVKILFINEIDKKNRTITNRVSRHTIDDGLYYDDDLLTWQELAAIAKNAIMAPTLPGAIETTYSLTADVYGDNRKEEMNNEVDAFRHCTLNIILAKHGIGLKDWKLNWARDFATAHEQGAKYYRYDSEMDLHNNSIGRGYYNSKTKKKKVWFVEVGVSGEPSYSDIRRDIKTKADAASHINCNQINWQGAINNAPGLVTISY